jgi:hypothetical protein
LDVVLRVRVGHTIHVRYIWDGFVENSMNDMMKQHFLAIPVTIFVLCLPALVSGSGLDAYVLAVQHFDPGHELGIEYVSDEVDFMRQVLREARNVVPAAAGLHLPVDGTVESKFGPSMYRSLRVRPQDSGHAWSDEEIESLRRVGEFIGLGCSYEEQINKRYHSNRFTGTTRLMQWNVGEHCREEGDRRICENHEVAEWLCSFGVESVTLKEYEYKGSKNAELFLTYNVLVDLEYNAMRLAGDPKYSAVFHDLELEPYSGTAIGDGPTVRVVPVDGLSGFDGVRVEFSAGWGDCPSGCIFRHYWLFEYRVKGERMGGDWPLVGGLIEESGDPLSE